MHTAFCYLVKIIWKVSYPAIYDASLVRLCFPDPPTPTNNAFPCGVRMIRDILIKWLIASCILTEKGMKGHKYITKQLDHSSGACAKDSVLYLSK